MIGYRLKITVKNSKPPVWWRIWIPGGMTFSALSIVLDAATGCDSSLPFQFSVHQKTRIFEPSEESPLTPNWYYHAEDASGVYINRLFDESSTLYYTIGDRAYKIDIESTCEDYPEDYPCPVKAKNIHGTSDSDAFLARLKDGIRFCTAEPRYPTKAEILAHAENGRIQIPVTDNPHDRENASQSSIRENLKTLSSQLWELQAEIDHLQKEIDAVKSYPMNEILSWYSVDDLNDIAEYYADFAFSAHSKEEMEKELADYLLDEDRLQKMLLRLDDEEFDALKQACEHVGVLSIEDEDDRFYLLEQYGYVFHSQAQQIYVPTELRDAFFSLNSEKFQLTRKKIKWVHSCIDDIVPPYYSEIPLDRFCRLCRRSDNPEIRPDEVPSLLDLIPEDDRECVVSDGMVFSKQLLHDQETRDYVHKSHEGKPYYIMRQREIEELLEYGYPAKEPHHVRMRKFFQNKMHLSEARAGKVTAQIHLYIAYTYKMQKIMDYLEEEKLVPKAKDLNEFMSLYQEMANNTPTFYNCGYTPNQMGELRKR